jgi:hypothetical protein
MIQGMQNRTLWHAPDLTMVDEPLLLSLVKYRLHKDRQLLPPFPEFEAQANLVSSYTLDDKQMPILDLDFDHLVVESTTDGHHHLYINVPMSRMKWRVLMLVLWWTGVVEMGNAVWSLRRGANFVRPPQVKKTAVESVKPTYGWIFKLKEH